MSTYRLERLLSPRSIAVVGAGRRERSLGRSVLRNLREAGFGGPIYVVNTQAQDIEGIPAFRAVQDLPVTPDLIVIAVPAASVPMIVAAAADQGVAAAIILTAGLGQGPGSLAETCEQAARAKGLRLLGPNCLGAIVPGVKYNATFASRISIGDQLDVDFGDLLDFYSLDRTTHAILLYIESIKDARKFMSAARAAARTKPVVVVKAGRHAQAAKAASTHTGALAGSDAVYDAAFL